MQLVLLDPRVITVLLARQDSLDRLDTQDQMEPLEPQDKPEQLAALVIQVRLDTLEQPDFQVRMDILVYRAQPDFMDLQEPQDTLEL